MAQRLRATRPTRVPYSSAAAAAAAATAASALTSRHAAVPYMRYVNYSPYRDLSPASSHDMRLMSDLEDDHQHMRDTDTTARLPLKHDSESDSPQSPPPFAPARVFKAYPLLPALVLVLLAAVLSTPLLISNLRRFLQPREHVRPSLPPARSLPGVAVIASCTNRHPMISRAFVSWLRVAHVNQILLLDWSSSPPLADTVLSLLSQHRLTAKAAVPDVRIVRVVNESSWALSRAYNLAARMADYDTLFKVDCDYLVQPNTVAVHRLPDSSAFYTGYYMNSRTANEIHLNGIMLLRRQLFWDVGGYDERIQTYGYDDEDLYTRLKATGARRLNLSYDHVEHIHHHDKTRAQAGIEFPRVQIDINRIALDELNDSWTSHHRHSEYLPVHPASDVVHAVFEPPSLRDLIPPDVYDSITELAFGSRLRDDFFIPWEVVGSMELPMRKKLLRNMLLRKEISQIDEVLQPGAAPPFILIHVQNGIGNRLRAIGSGLAYARATNCEPIVIWESDVHFGASFSQIFSASRTPFAVLDSFKPRWPLAPLEKHDNAWGRIVYYNYMLPDGVDAVKNQPNKNIYFKSASVMKSDVTTWEKENFEIKQLVFNTEITDLAKRTYQRLGQPIDSDSRFSRIGGVHVRNRSLDNDIPGFANQRDTYHEKDQLLLDKWRTYTKMGNFIGEMKGLLYNGTIDKFFVASDTVAVCQKLANSFDEGKVLFIPRDCDGRGWPCLKFAVADLLVLGKSDILLGSTWSSFTEAAMRLGGPKALLAGSDFGKRPPSGK